MFVITLRYLTVALAQLFRNLLLLLCREGSNVQKASPQDVSVWKLCMRGRSHILFFAGVSDWRGAGVAKGRIAALGWAAVSGTLHPVLQLHQLEEPKHRAPWEGVSDCWPDIQRNAF